MALGCLLAAARCHSQSRSDVKGESSDPRLPDAATPPGEPREGDGAGGRGDWIWGVTVDDVTAVADIVDALEHLPRRPTTRIVFDEGQPATSYQKAAAAIHDVSHVMGEILDSMYVKTLDIKGYRSRTAEYVNALGEDVDIWEIGNEVNGEWLGTTADVVAKISAAHEVVKARGKTTALTLYYNAGCWSEADHEMFAWAERNLPAAVKQGIDYLLVSYYEDDCEGLQPDWPAVFAKLAVMFPKARLGFGECGTTDPAKRTAYVTRYYTTRLLAEPRFIGGFFWWYFAHDMVPRTKPLWSVLATAMTTPP
jgi:hypothetical protein